jgi:iron complex outermembrane receptor protein
MSFDLPEGRAIETLREAALQGESQILFSDIVVEGVMTKAIRGQYSPREALVLMLKSTGLGLAQANTNGAYAITLADREIEAGGSNDITSTIQSYSEHKIETKMNTKKNNWFKTLVAAITLGIAGGQGGLSGQEDSEDEVYDLSPFVVNESESKRYLAQQSTSGTRIAIPLTRIPQKITTLTAEFLEDLNAFGTDEAVYYAGVERFRFQQSGVSIRGFRAAFQVDNLDWGTDIKMDNIITERIDIAKGPAGTIYGVGAPGGAINLITKKPSSETFGHMRMIYGSRNSYRIEGDFTGSLNEDKTLLYRVSAARNRIETDLLFGEMTLDTLMPQIAWQPSEKTSINLQLIYQDTPDWQPFDERFPTIGGKVTPPNPDYPERNGAVGFTPGVPENFNVPGPNSQRSDTTWWFTADWTQIFSDAVSMKLAYRKTWFDEERWTRFMMAGASLDASGNVKNPDLRVGNWFQSKERVGETLQADFNFEWDGKNGLNGSITTGGNYFVSDFDNLIFWDINCCGQSNAVRGNTINIINPSRDPNSQDWSFSTFKQDYVLNNWEDQITHGERAAVWALSNTYFANERGNFLVGARKSYSLGKENSVLRGTRFDNRGNQNDQFGGNTQSLDTYMAGGTYEISRNDNDYVTAFFGYSETNDFNRFPYAPKKGGGYEGGLRWSTGDRKLVTSLSYWNITQENILRKDPNLGGELVLSGKEASQGLELELFYYPFDGATFFFQIVDQDTEIVSHAASPFLQGNPAGDGGYETAFSGAFTYKVPDGEHRGAGFTLGFINRGEVAPFPDNNNLFALRQPGYTVANLNFWYPIKLRNDDQSLNLELSIKNLTDEFYFRGAMIPGHRRTIYGGARWNF